MYLKSHFQYKISSLNFIILNVLFPGQAYRQNPQAGKAIRGRHGLPRAAAPVAHPRVAEVPAQTAQNDW